MRHSEVLTVPLCPSEDARTVCVMAGADSCEFELFRLIIRGVQTKETLVSRLFRRERLREPTAVDIEVLLAEDVHVMNLPKGTMQLGYQQGWHLGSKASGAFLGDSDQPA